jgi:transcription initiation factor TFIIIB Brf1 subunit/transcription initiation factor TFIIB
MSTLAEDFANAKIQISNMVEHLPSPRRCEDNAKKLLDCVYEKQRFKKSDPDILASACLYIIIRFVL